MMNRDNEKLTLIDVDGDDLLLDDIDQNDIESFSENASSIDSETMNYLKQFFQNHNTTVDTTHNNNNNNNNDDNSLSSVALNSNNKKSNINTNTSSSQRSRSKNYRYVLPLLPPLNDNERQQQQQRRRLYSQQSSGVDSEVSYPSGIVFHSETRLFEILSSRKGPKSVIEESRKRQTTTKHKKQQQKQKQQLKQKIINSTHGCAGGTTIANSNSPGPQQQQANENENNNNDDKFIDHDYHDDEIAIHNDILALENRLRDFESARKRRFEKYGNDMPWGILGLYDHLSCIRTDVEWAEDAAWRRQNSLPYLSWKDFEVVRKSGFNKPFFTYFVMILCTIFLLASFAVNDWKIELLKVNPMIGPSAATLITMGAKETTLIVVENQWYRLFSPMVLHAGIIHYLLNMLALRFIGSAVEMNHGFVRAALLFIIPAFGGMVLSALFLPEYISVGASGGIFGFIGACLADIFSNWNLLFSKEVNVENDGVRFRHAKVLLWLLLDIIVNILVGMTPYVDNFTHLGGMIYGFLLGLGSMERLSKSFFGISTSFFSSCLGCIFRFIGIIISCIFLLITIVLLFESGEVNSFCSGCRYISCVPFPFWAKQGDKWWYCDDCDKVTVKAYVDKETNFFTGMNLTCPDDTVEYIDFSNSPVSDIVWLERQIPTYCRDHCDNVYMTN